MIRETDPPRVVSLFSGIGGFEKGLEKAGYATVL
ncbi:MAG: DNA cytosine methyltransferase, partial [Mesorhizobium sp.]